MQPETMIPLSKSTQKELKDRVEFYKTLVKGRMSYDRLIRAYLNSEFTEITIQELL